MTTSTFDKEAHKDSYDDDLGKILASLVDEDGICKTCGQDHSFTKKEKIGVLSSKCSRLT